MTSISTLDETEIVERGGVVDYRHLAIMAGSSTIIKSSYIVDLTKMQKRQPPAKSICPIENYTYAIRAKMSD